MPILALQIVCASDEIYCKFSFKFSPMVRNSVLQRLVANESDEEEWPSELLQLRDRFTEKYEREIKKLKKQHHEETEKLKDEHLRVLNNALERARRRSLRDSDKTEIEILRERYRKTILIKFISVSIHVIFPRNWSTTFQMFPTFLYKSIIEEYYNFNQKLLSETLIIHFSRNIILLYCIFILGSVFTPYILCNCENWERYSAKSDFKPYFISRTENFPNTAIWKT